MVLLEAILKGVVGRLAVRQWCNGNKFKVSKVAAQLAPWHHQDGVPGALTVRADYLPAVASQRDNVAPVALVEAILAVLLGTLVALEDAVQQGCRDGGHVRHVERFGVVLNNKTLLTGRVGTHSAFWGEQRWYTVHDNSGAQEGGRGRDGRHAPCLPEVGPLDVAPPAPEEKGRGMSRWS